VVVHPGHGFELAAVGQPAAALMSSCHSCIGWARSQRRQSVFRCRRARGSMSRLRTKAR
jgi:hypothetical protein